MYIIPKQRIDNNIIIMTIFHDKSDVAIFFILAVILFTPLFVGNIQTYINKDNEEWYNKISKRIKLMPPSIVFPIMWTIIYILIFIAMFMFFRKQNFPTDQGYVIDTVSVLFIFNIMANKIWSYVFFHRKETLNALLLTLFIIITAVVINIMFALSGKWIEFSLFLCYILWCCFALYINSVWLYIEKFLLLSDDNTKIQSYMQKSQFYSNNSHVYTKNT